MQTQIPLFELKGPGGTSIGYSIYHRSFQQSNGYFATYNGSVGRGWSQSAMQNTSASGPTQNMNGNSVNTWRVTNFNATTGVQTIERKPDTHADLQRFMNTSHQTIGYDITMDADKSVWSYKYVRADQQLFGLSSITDKHGNAVTYEYNAQNLPSKVTDASGLRYYTVSYNTETNPQVTAVTLFYPGGSKTWNFNYVNDYLMSIDYPAPTTGAARPHLNFVYDANSNITDFTDLNGNTWHYVYGKTWPNSSLDYLIGVKEIHEPTTTPGNWNSASYTSFAYTVASTGDVSTWNLGCQITDQLGRIWKHIYYNGSGSSDDLPHPIKQTIDPTIAADAATYSDSYVWSLTDCTLTQYTDKRGNPWTFTYDTDNRGLMLSQKNPLNQTTQYLYDANYKLVRTIDANGDRTINTYSPTTLDLTKTIADPKTDPYDAAYSRPTGVALTTNYTYSPQGELATTWTGTDAPTTYSNFDSYGNSKTVTPPSGSATTYTFDAQNNVLNQTEPSPRGATNFTYDLWNRLTKTTFPDTKFVTATYDSNNNVVSAQDENGYISTKIYDGENRVVSAMRPVDANAANNITVVTGYDAAGNPTTLTNGRGKITTTDFNERHEAVKVTYPDGTNRRSGYDGNGNKNRRWDGKGRLTTYSYDTANRLLTTTYADSSSVTNTWRADSARTAMTDWSGTSTWTINGADQVTANYQPRSTRTVTYTYDGSGRKKTMQIGAQIWTYNYDTALRVQNIQQNVGTANAVVYTYFPDSSVNTKTMGANLRTYYTWNTRGRITSIAHHTLFSGDIVAQHVDYTYDGVGNVLTYSNQTGGAAPQVTTYSYDRGNRLLTESRVQNSATQFSNVYAYDKNGNRAVVTRGGVASAYTVDNNDKLSAGDGVTLSSYDSDGNPASIAIAGTGTYAFAYDIENRPSQIVTPTATTSYRYDGDGHRIEKTVGGVTTRYVYDGDTIVADANPASPNAFSNFYLPGVGEATATATQTFYNENALGNMLTSRSDAGSSTYQSEYDAYGIAYPIAGSTTSPYRFVGGHGYMTDDETGLNLLGHRYYVPKLGRFLTQDPIGFMGGLNLYAYCDNNPVTGIDPSGLDSFKLPDSPGVDGANMPDGWTRDEKDKNPFRERYIGPNADQALSWDRKKPDALRKRPGKDGCDLFLLNS